MLRILTIATLLLAGCEVNQQSESPVATTDAAATAPATEATSKPIRILAWNIESGGSDTTKILTQLIELPQFDVLALSEVPSADIPQIEALFAKEQTVTGTKGGNDRLMIVVSSELEVVRTIELKEYRPCQWERIHLDFLQ